MPVMSRIIMSLNGDYLSNNFSSELLLELCDTSIMEAMFHKDESIMTAGRAAGYHLLEKIRNPEVYSSMIQTFVKKINQNQSEFMKYSFCVAFLNLDFETFMKMEPATQDKVLTSFNSCLDSFKINEHYMKLQGQFKKCAPRIAKHANANFA
jgi:hypothetical protein